MSFSHNLYGRYDLCQGKISYSKIDRCLGYAIELATRLKRRLAADVVIYDIIWDRFHSTFGRTFRLVYGFMIPRLCRSARHLITVSELSTK